MSSRPGAVKGSMDTTIPALDEAAFAERAEAHRRELHLHCYRMMGSVQDAEDLTQETLLRAWRRRETFEGRSAFRTWLHRIATNACLDALERRPRTVSGDADEVLWLQPYPDRMLDDVVARETIELAFLVAIQHLTPRTRAVLLARDLLGWSAKDTAELLGTSVASVNSALQRARESMRARLPESPAGASASAQERAVVERYLEAMEADDPRAFVEMMRDDARFSMPPNAGVYVGAETVVASWVEGGFGTEAFGRLRGLATAANRQPAIANYHLAPGDDAYRPLAIDVLRVEDGLIAEILAFGVESFEAYGLPPTLS